MKKKSEKISLTVPKKSGPFCFGMAFYLMLDPLDALKMKIHMELLHMVKVSKCALISLMHKKWTLRVELTKKKTSHCKSRDFLRKRRLKTSHSLFPF